MQHSILGEKERLLLLLKKKNLKHLSDIVNKKREMKLSVTKNASMAKQMNHSIMSQM